MTSRKFIVLGTLKNYLMEVRGDGKSREYLCHDVNRVGTRSGAEEIEKIKELVVEPTPEPRFEVRGLTTTVNFVRGIYGGRPG